MPITTSKTELFTSGPISFSSLQSSLGGSSNDVRFSTYLRNDDINELNPVVPDATENESIPPISDPKNLGISSFRGIIKEYVINQSGLDESLDLSEDRIIDNNVCAVVGYTGPWNGNLGKNIPKKVSIGGTCYASDVSRFGASIDGFISNLEVEVSDTGAIYGAGGAGGRNGFDRNGQNGGGALYVNNIRSSNADSSKVKITLNPDAKIWSGGGGGGVGESGRNGPIITCSSTTTVTNYPTSGGTRNCPTNDKCPNGYTEASCSPTDTRSNCRGGSPRRFDAGYVCAGNWVRKCNLTTKFTRSGAGGDGGDGGVGRGFLNINSSLSGSSGLVGSAESCADGTVSIGDQGLRGSSGGDWGERGGGRERGGDRGAAVTGVKEFIFTGRNTDNLKGGILQEFQIGGVPDELDCSVPDPTPDPTPVPTITEKTNAYTTPGIYSLIVPVGVSSISITAIGGGAGGGGGQSERFSTDGDSGGGGGGAGGLGYTINTPVTSGQTIWIQVGAGGAGGAHRESGRPGGDSLVRLTSSTGTLLCAGYGGENGTNYRIGGTGGSFVGDGGGNGGNGGTGVRSRERGGGGGGAGGYSGAGGNGALAGNTTRLPGPGGTVGGFGGTNSGNGELGAEGGDGISLDGISVVSASSQVFRDGGNGAAFGAGGGGATLDTAPRNPTTTGGNGGNGAVKITYLQTI